MHPPVDERRIRALASELSRVAHGQVRICLTGGATAVLEGWRAATIDVDVRFEPDADELLRALPELKERLHAARQRRVASWAGQGQGLRCA